MRHTVTTAAVTVLFCTLTATACGSSDDDGGGKGDGKPSAAPSPTSSAARQAAYLADAKTIPFTGSGPTHDELTAYPPKWCAGLDSGHSVKWLFSGGGGGLYPIGQGWGTVEKNANLLLIAGVKAYCPQHLDTVTGELRDAGKY